MIISDLNYLEVVSQANSIEGGSVYEADQFELNIKSHPDIIWNTAFSQGRAQAYGIQTFTKTVNNTLAVQGQYSESQGLAVSGAMP